MEVINLPYRSAILIWRVVSFQFTILNAFKFTLEALVQFQPVRLLYSLVIPVNYWAFLVQRFRKGGVVKCHEIDTETTLVC